MAIMSRDSEERLKTYSHCLKLSDGSYLQDETNQNFQYIRERYFNNNTDRTKLLNIGSGLFSAVSNTIARFFDYPNMELEVSGLREAVDDLNSINFCVFTVDNTEEGYIINRGYAGGYVFEDGTHKIFTQYSQVDEGGFTFYYLYEKDYLPGMITRKLWKLSGKDSFRIGYEEVSLDTISETYGLEPVTLTGLDKPSLYVVGDVNGISVLQEVEPMVYSVDRKVVMADTQFLQNVESFKLFKGFTKEELGVTDGEKINLTGRSIITDEIDSSIEFVKNTNELIDKSIAYEETQIRRISAITSIPLRFLGIEEKDGSSGRNARYLTQSAFIKMLDGLKTMYKMVFQQILRDLKKDDFVQFKETVLKDSYDLAEEMKIARESKIISQLTAIKTYQGIDDEKANEEIVRIEAEEDDAMEREIELADSTKSTTSSDTTIQLGADSSQEKDAGPRERSERNDR